MDRLAWGLVLVLLGCAADDEGLDDAAVDSEAADDAGERFACGDQGGSCDLDTELCVLGGPDRCSTCVPLPPTCEGSSSCECVPPGSDPAIGDAQCVDAGTCEVVGGGLVLTCDVVEWGCG